MIPITLIASIALVLIAREFFGYLKAKDDMHYRERRELVTRIQSPDMAPMLFPAPPAEDDTTGYSEETEVLQVVRGEVA